MRWSKIPFDAPPALPVRQATIDALLTRDAVAAAPWLAGGICLLVYSATLANDITWANYGGDGGELISASMTFGVPHPPGYPLYSLLGRLFGALPFGTIAARYSLLSAVACALAVALFVHLMTMRNQSKPVSIQATLAIGLALAFTPLIWGQAIIAEVYTLYLALLAFFVWTILTGRQPLLVGLAFGLAVSGHLSGFLLLPLALWYVARSGLPRFALGAFLGLSPFLLLPLLSLDSSPVIWGDLDSLEGWWWLVSARLYRPNLFALPPGQWTVRFAQWFSPAILIPVLIWLALALASLWRIRRERDLRPLAFFATSVLYGIYGFTYSTADAAVLLLPGILLAAMVAGRWLARTSHIAIWLLPVIMLALAITSGVVESDNGIRSSATGLLAKVPNEAIVLTPGDATISAFWYFHSVEGIRPDLIIVDENMFQFYWYRERLRVNHTDLLLPTEDDLATFIANNSRLRPVCRLTLANRGHMCTLPGRRDYLE